MPSIDLLAIFDEMSVAIEREIAAGFHPAADIAADVAELYSADADAEVVAAAARRIADEALREQLMEQAYWPAITDCDRLDAAFAELERAGIICRQNFTCCATCGTSEIQAVIAAERRRGRTVRGYAFYHQQDTERAIEGDGLLLNFGTVSGGEAAAVAVAQDIVAQLAAHGLQVDWNGQWARRIGVRLEWQRRRVN